MAIGNGSLIEMAVVGSAFDQTIINTWTYEVGNAPVSSSAADWGEAWWNHVKAAYRGIPTTDYTTIFEVVRVRELDTALGEYGEFAVPISEMAGTRSVAASTAVAPFIAAGVRLTVGTRVTRPGQKRFAGLGESDLDHAALTSAVNGAVDTLMTLMTGPVFVLGAPAALGELTPVIVRRDPVTGLPVAHQRATGYVRNPNYTTQNTRKIGRGI